MERSIEFSYPHGIADEARRRASDMKHKLSCQLEETLSRDEQLVNLTFEIQILECYISGMAQSLHDSAVSIKELDSLLDGIRNPPKPPTKPIHLLRNCMRAHYELSCAHAERLRDVLNAFCDEHNIVAPEEDDGEDDGPVGLEALAEELAKVAEKVPDGAGTDKLAEPSGDGSTESTEIKAPSFPKPGSGSGNRDAKPYK